MPTERPLRTVEERAMERSTSILEGVQPQSCPLQVEKNTPPAASTKSLCRASPNIRLTDYSAYYMIDFVTWPPLIVYRYKKFGKVTKPIILVKIWCVIQGVKT